MPASAQLSRVRGVMPRRADAAAGREEMPNGSAATTRSPIPRPAAPTYTASSPCSVAVSRSHTPTSLCTSTAKVSSRFSSRRRRRRDGTGSPSLTSSATITCTTCTRRWNTPKGFGRGQRNRAETEANVFASSLLMPQASFTKAYDELYPNIVALARRSDVSPAAAEVRCEVFGLPV